MMCLRMMCGIMSGCVLMCDVCGVGFVICVCVGVVLCVDWCVVVW